MSKIVKGSLGCLLIFLLNQGAVAGDAGKIRVVQIAPTVVDSVLSVSARFENLFSDKIVGTIQSGLPSIVQVEIKLVDARNKVVTRRALTRTISYDIWNEVYTIQGEDSTAHVTTFQQVQALVTRLRNLAVTPVQKLTRAMPYRLQLRVGIIPISARQAHKVSDWILNPNQTEESVASQDRSTGFKFTLSNLVSFFMGSNRSPRYVSNWFSSQRFRLEELP